MKEGLDVQLITDQEFVLRCREFLEQIERSGGEIRIARGGRTIARLISFTEDVRPFIGRSDGTIEASAYDLIAPVGKDWEVDQDL